MRDLPAIAACPSVGARIVGDRAAFHFEGQHPEFGMGDDEIAFAVYFLAIWFQPEPRPRIEHDEGIIQHGFQPPEHLALRAAQHVARDIGR